MTTENEELVRRAYGAFGARDLDALRELADPGVEISTITGVLAERDEPYRGHEGLARYMADVAEVWDELELVPGEFHELDPERLLVFGRVRARRGPKLIDAPTAWLWHLRAGRIAGAQIFGDAQVARDLLAGGTFEPGG